MSKLTRGRKRELKQLWDLVRKIHHQVDPESSPYLSAIRKRIAELEAASQARGSQ